MDYATQLDLMEQALAGQRASGSQDWTQACLSERPPFLGKDPSPLDGYFEHQESFLLSGELIWGRLIRVELPLLKEGPTDYPASLIYSRDPRVREEPRLLTQMARTLLPSAGRDQESSETARQAADAIVQAHGWAETRAIPEHVAGIAGMLIGVMVVRSHLPRGFVRGSLVPVLTLPGVTDHAMILPSTFWPPEFTEREW